MWTAIAESAVVPIFHDVKGEALYCFVTLRDGHDFTEQLQAELKQKGNEILNIIQDRWKYYLSSFQYNYI